MQYIFNKQQCSGSFIILPCTAESNTHPTLHTNEQLRCWEKKFSHTSALNIYLEGLAQIADLFTTHTIVQILLVCLEQINRTVKKKKPITLVKSIPYCVSVCIAGT